MRPEDCPKLDECHKIKMVLDHDLLDPQYAESIRSVCGRCNEGNKPFKGARGNKECEAGTRVDNSPHVR